MNEQTAWELEFRTLYLPYAYCKPAMVPFLTPSVKILLYLSLNIAVGKCSHYSCAPQILPACY